MSEIGYLTTDEKEDVILQVNNVYKSGIEMLEKVLALPSNLVRPLRTETFVYMLSDFMASQFYEDDDETE